MEPLLARAGIRILSKITGDSTFEEITWAHQAKVNVVVCSRALINVAREMERRYDIPFVEVSFFGSTEIAKALRRIAFTLQSKVGRDEPSLTSAVEGLIKVEEKRLKQQLEPYQHLRGKKAVLYTGGVKSWSFISALLDLGIEIVAVGTKKSTIEDEEKMKEILGPDAPLVEDVTPKNLLRLLKERNADILIAGGRNQYLAIKEGYPFVDVNQERHIPYAGYPGLVNLAEQISNSLCFYERSNCGMRKGDSTLTPAPFDKLRAGLSHEGRGRKQSAIVNPKSAVLIDPLKHSPSIGAAIAFQGIDRALPIIHGAQGCTFLGKVLLTKHFREPIALATSKLFVEDVVMGSEEKLTQAIAGFIEKNDPALIGVLSSGLSEVKGDDVAAVVRRVQGPGSRVRVIHVPTPDFDGGLETGYARAIEALIGIADCGLRIAESPLTPSHSTCSGQASPQGERGNDNKQVNVLAGSHLTPADFSEIRKIVESFGMRAIILPDLSSLDGSRQSFSPLAAGGTSMAELTAMADASLTIALGMSMEPAAKLLQQKFGTGYRMFDSTAGLKDSDLLMQALTEASGRPLPAKYERQRKVLVDVMRDAHIYFGGRKICIALEPDLAVQTSKWLDEMGARVELAVIPTLSNAADRIRAREVRIGDLFSIKGEYDAIVSNSHAEGTAKRLGIPLFEMGFPVYKTFGYTSKVTAGYRGTLALISEMANLLMKGH